MVVPNTAQLTIKISKLPTKFAKFLNLSKIGAANIKQLFETIIAFFSKKIDEFTKFIDDLFDALKKHWEKIKYLKSEFGEAFSKFWDELGASVQLAKEVSLSAVTTSGNVIKADPIYEIVYKGKVVWEGGKDATKKFYDEIKNLPKKARDKRLIESANAIQLRKILDNYLLLRTKYLKYTQKQLDELWSLSVKANHFRRTDLLAFHKRYIEKYPLLKVNGQKNIAEFQVGFYDNTKK